MRRTKFNQKTDIVNNEFLEEGLIIKELFTNAGSICDGFVTILLMRR